MKTAFAVPVVVIASLAVAAAPAVASVSARSLSLGEGQPYTGTVASVTSGCAPENLAPRVSWGDGATTDGAVVATGRATFDIRAGHTYADPGAYGLSVHVKECATGGLETGSGSVQVADAALTPRGMTLAATAGTPFSGTVATFADADPGAKPSDYLATIDWGDGHATAGTVAGDTSGGFRVEGSSTYAAAGSHAVTVTIDDIGGGAAVASSSMVVAAPPTPARGFVAAGADRRHAPKVRVHDAITGQLRSSFFAYPRGFRGGVRVAVGDVDGDGVADIITAPGRGAGAHVRVFSGASGHVLRSFLAFEPAFRNGAYVAAGDVNGDRKADVIVGAGAGARVKVFDGGDGHLRSSFLAYGASFAGGVRVAAGDVNGDGRADVIAGPGRGGSPQIKVLGAANGAVLKSFMAYGPSLTRGIFVAAGDVDGDSRADIVAGPGRGAAPHVKVFSGANGATLMSFMAYGASFMGGVRTAAADADGDGRADVITSAGPGGSAHVRAFSGVDASPLSSFVAGSPAAGPVFVGAGR